MKKILLTIATAIGASIFTANAQQDLMLTQEIFSRINKNPAATGNTETVDAFLHGRIQWAGVDNSPKTGVLNVTDYCENLHSGFGLTLAYDQFGVGHSNTNAKIVYSYQMDLNENTILALGLSAGVNANYFNFGDNTVESNYEHERQLFEADKTTSIQPDFDLGFELSQRYWTLGASVTHLNQSESDNQTVERHYNVYATSMIPVVKGKFDLGPTVAYMHRNKTNLLEVGTLGFYRQILWGGVAWRPDLNNGCNPSTLAFTLGIEWNHKFRFGYSYDMGLGSESQLPSNTHEVVLSYSFDKGGKSKKD